MVNINQIQLKKVFGKVAMLLAVVALFVFGLNYNNSSAAITKEISYQGKLTNTSNVAVADGNYNMVISIYDAASGGNCLWTARGTCGSPTARSVAVANGIFSIMLGETGDNAINLDFNSTYYLGIKIGADTEMSPRKKIGSSGYAFNSDRLDGYDETAFAMLNGRTGGQTLTGGTAANNLLVLKGNSASGNTATNAAIQMKVGDNGVTTAMTILNNGNVGIGTTSPGYKLDVQGGQVNVSGGFCIAGDCKTSWSGVGGYVAGNDLDLSGTTFNIESQLDYVSVISRASSDLTLQTTTSGNIILNPADNVGVGTSSPTNAKMQVERTWGGGASLTTDSVIKSVGSNVSNQNYKLFSGFHGNTEVFYVNGQGTAYFNGSIGIGTTTPTALMTINGNGTNAGLRVASSYIDLPTGQKMAAEMVANDLLLYLPLNSSVASSRPVFDQPEIDPPSSND